METDVHRLARQLSLAPPRAIPRIAGDLVLWAALAAVALRWPATTLFMALIIGFGPMHDLLISGHESIHGLVSRNRRVNEVFLWFLHALFGVSGTAHRAFHLQHHRCPHRDGDPEWAILRRLGGRGWSYLVLPLAAPIGVYLFFLLRWGRWSSDRKWAFWRDIVLMGLLHAGLALALGPYGYAVVLVIPGLVGLFPAFVLRSLFEHHGARPDDPWREAHTLVGNPLLRWFWSNIDLHLEHHRHPSVPIRYLPAIHEALLPEFEAHGVVVHRGWVKTWFELVFVPHFPERR